MAGTIRAVAEAAGVSKTAVSFVMNNTKPQVDRIPRETQERIRACAAALGYTHNPIAASIRTGKRVWVGVMTEVLPSVRWFWDWAPFFDISLLYGVQRELAEHGYFTLLALRKAESEVKDLDQLASAKVGGLIFRAADVDAVKKAEDLQAAGIHVINVFPRRPTDLYPFVVDLDNAKAGRLSAEMIAQSGARNPAYISLPNCGSAMQDRIDGFIQSVKENIGVVPGSCELPRTPEGLIITPSAYKVLDSFITRNRPDAIVTFDGGSSLILNAALDTISVEIPKDIAIIGFDAFLCRNNKYQTMSSIGVSWLQAGEVAAKIVVNQIENNCSDGLPRFLDPAFVPGDSTPPGLVHELAVENLNTFISAEM